MASDAPLSFRAFQRLIRDRYYETDAARGAAGTFLWFIEEVGELATAIQRASATNTPPAESRKNLEEELADVLAWLTTIANVCDVDLESALSKYTDETRVRGVKG